MSSLRAAGWVVLSLTVFTGCGQTPTASPASPPTAPTTTSLDGEWAVVAMRGVEISASPDELAGMRWSIRGEEITAVNPDGRSGKMSFRLDTAQQPHTIDIAARGDNATRDTDLGICAVEAGRLRLCLAEEGHPRPAEFRVSPQAWIMELERIRR